MSVIAISQRVVVDPRFGERRDCLDQAWIKFMMICGLTPMQVPNEEETARSLCNGLPLSGILLTGGNDLLAYGGDAPERDSTENMLLDIAEERNLPVLGVCRGMQMIQHRLGIRLERVAGHVTAHQIVSIEGKPEEVNSYHNFGATETRPPLEAWAIADDGVVKAVRHTDGRMAGIMWHPERLNPLASRDISFFQNFFGSH
jgi:N5-(cytidine 5'-diphosphoramidyl)-L-glutamine hydrolase